MVDLTVDEHDLQMGSDRQNTDYMHCVIDRYSNQYFIRKQVNKILVAFTGAMLYSSALGLLLW